MRTPQGVLAAALMALAAFAAVGSLLPGCADALGLAQDSYRCGGGW